MFHLFVSAPTFQMLSFQQAIQNQCHQELQPQAHDQSHHPN